MNSVLLTNTEDVISEIQEMLKNIENIKAGIDMFGEIVKSKITNEAV